MSRSSQQFTRTLGLLLVLLFRSSLDLGQTPPGEPAGALQVSVLDANGQPLSAAFIRIEQGKKIVAQDRTSFAGLALLNRLVPGPY
jgi:hypothetical protein